MTDMSGSSGEHPVHDLNERECWQLLQQEELGRVALTFRGETEIFPVNYLSDQGRILIRTEPGTKLAGMLTNSRVAFEVDGHDGHSAWSVVVKGLAEEVALHPAVLQHQRVPTPWIDARKDTVVEITPSAVSGRVFERRARAELNEAEGTPVEGAEQQVPQLPVEQRHAQTVGAA